MVLWVHQELLVQLELLVHPVLQELLDWMVHTLVHLEAVVHLELLELEHRVVVVHLEVVVHLDSMEHSLVHLEAVVHLELLELEHRVVVEVRVRQVLLEHPE